MGVKGGGMTRLQTNGESVILHALTLMLSPWASLKILWTTGIMWILLIIRTRHCDIGECVREKSVSTTGGNGNAGAAGSPSPLDPILWRARISGQYTQRSDLIRIQIPCQKSLADCSKFFVSNFVKILDAVTKLKLLMIIEMAISKATDTFSILLLEFN